MNGESTCLIRAAKVNELPEHAFRHPLNPESEVYMRSLSTLAGLQRVALTVARIPPGRESFIYHFHHHQEEFLYILSGRGVAEIGAETYEVGPGDAMLFPAPSPAHHLRNPFDADLVYLMGGEHGSFEIGEYPRLQKRGIFSKDEAYIVDDDAMRLFTMRREDLTKP